MLGFLSNVAPACLQDRTHQNFLRDVGIVRLGEDAVGHGIPTRFCNCQVTAFQEVGTGKFHLGFKTPERFMKMKAETTDVRGVSSVDLDWSTLVKRLLRHVIVDLAAMESRPVDQSQRSFGLTKNILDHVLQSAPLGFSGVLMWMMWF